MKATYQDAQDTSAKTTRDLAVGQIGVTEHGGLVLAVTNNTRVWLSGFDGGDDVPSVNLIPVRLSRILPVGSTVTLTVQV
jgi:hypothetical protein